MINRQILECNFYTLYDPTQLKMQYERVIKIDISNYKYNVYSTFVYEK